MNIEAENVREYAEGLPVVIYAGEHNTFGGPKDRPVVVARNEGGFNVTAIDVLDLLHWISDNKPEWIPYKAAAA